MHARSPSTCQKVGELLASEDGRNVAFPSVAVLSLRVCGLRFGIVQEHSYGVTSAIVDPSIIDPSIIDSSIPLSWRVITPAECSESSLAYTTILVYKLINS